MDWEVWGGVFCGISIIFVYLFTYLHIYTLFGERCRSVVLYLVVFCYGFRIHQYFFVFSVFVFCILLGEGHVVSPPSVCNTAI